MPTIQWTTYTGQNVNGGLYYGIGNRFNGIFHAGETITKISFRLYKTNSVTGNLEARILLSTHNNGSEYLKIFGSSIDLSTLTASPVWYEWNDTYTLPETTDYRVTLYFPDGSNLDNCYINQYNGHSLAGVVRTTCLLYNQPFSDYDPFTFIVLFKIEYLTVAGKHRAFIIS